MSDNWDCALLETMDGCSFLIIMDGYIFLQLTYDLFISTHALSLRGPSAFLSRHPAGAPVNRFLLILTLLTPIASSSSTGIIRLIVLFTSTSLAAWLILEQMQHEKMIEIQCYFSKCAYASVAIASLLLRRSHSSKRFLDLHHTRNH